jgi:uncharacterized protein (DUF302 family)
MDGDRQTVHYGPASVPGFHVVVRSKLGFADTLARLQQALAAHDLWLIHEIDPQMLLARGGYDIAPARQLLFFHPRYAARLLAVDPAAVPEIPLKLVVLQMPDGSVTVRHPDVAAQFARYPGLAALGEELAALVRSLVATIVA